MILSFGADVKVMAPESLKTFVKEQAEMVLRQLT